MSAPLIRRRVYATFLTCAAALAIAAPAAHAGTSDADIDAVPGLRQQLNRQADVASDGSPSRNTRVVRGTTNADIDAVPGLREQLSRQAAAAPADDGTAGFQWADAGLGAAGAVGLLAVIGASAIAVSAVRRRDGQTPSIG